jgi:hypothetical protein
MVEDHLFCKDINAGTTGKDLFEIVDNFMTKNQIDWAHCVGVCTDDVQRRAVTVAYKHSSASKLLMQFGHIVLSIEAGTH